MTIYNLQNRKLKKVQKIKFKELFQLIENKINNSMIKFKIRGNF